MEDAKITLEDGKTTSYTRVPVYDNYGRVSALTSTFDGNTWTESSGYDTLGRADWSRDASGQGVKLEYTTRGFVREKHDIGDSTIVYQRIEKVDHFGHVVNEKAGSGAIVTTRDYYPLTGRLKNISSIGNAQTLQKLAYTWDDLGNLMSRSDYSSGRNLSETFDYDGLNRLITQNGTEYARYDAEGNITHKKDVTNFVSGQEYQYGGTCNGVQAGPHALTAAEGEGYCYDRNGNQVSGKGRTLVYNNTFDLPTKIRTSKHTTDFVYGPSHQRLKRVDSNTTTGRATTYYVGNVEIIVKAGKTEFRRNLGNAVINNGIVSYLLTDHLGSTQRVVNCSGGILQNMSFDPFGDKRNAETWTKLYVDFNSVATMARSTEWLISPISNSRTLHGFTGHEQMDEVGLIHMNGRVFDAHLGRFLQADPVIQAPTNSQSLNRYSYIINNPLSGVDPSGFSWWMTTGRQNVGTIVAVVITVVCIIYGCTALAAAAWQALGAMVTTYALTGSTRAAFRAGAAAFIGSYVGAKIGNVQGWSDWSAVGQHAVLGGVTSVLQGGKFGHGFAAAGFSTYVSGNLNFKNPVARTVTAAVVGGTASELSGGKFANGATTAAFQAMVTQIADHSRRTASIDELAPSQMSTDTKPKIAFVGGAMDSTTGLLKQHYESYVKRGGDAVYLEWTDSKELTAWLEVNAGESTIVMAHSYGADTAMGVIANGHYVSRLITFDPVGWFRPDFSRVAMFSGRWDNFNAIGGGFFNFNNFVATIGGKYGAAPSAYATTHTDINLDHGSICSDLCDATNY